MKYGLLVVDDHPMVRVGLVAQLSRCVPLRSQLLRVEAVPNAEEGLALVEVCPIPWLVMLDLCLDGLSGTAAVRAFSSQESVHHVVVVSGLDQNVWADEVRACGAAAYLSKTAEVGRIAECILGMIGPGARCDRAPQLTRQQKEVLARVAAGCTNRIIAHQLGLSELTVKIHVAQIQRELNASNRLKAVQVATRLGLLNEEAPRGLQTSGASQQLHLEMSRFRPVEEPAAAELPAAARTHVREVRPAGAMRSTTLASAAGADGPSRDCGLLIVDDNPVARAWIRGQLRRRLGPMGRNIQSADSIEAAQSLLREASGPQLVLLDISMPGLSGVEALRAMTPCPNVAGVITVSGMNPEIWKSRMLDAGACAYVQKTTDGEALVDCIRAVLTSLRPALRSRAAPPGQ